VVALAEQGWEKSFAAIEGFADGLNVHQGAILHPQVAEALDLPLVSYPRAA
jgi:alanine dehydrogenase